MSPSGSLPDPASVTVVRSSAVWSLPASAVGAPLTCPTVTVTSSVALSEPSLTVNRNVSAVLTVTSGAVNVGDAALVLLSVTVGPAVCVQAWLTLSPSGSELPEPSSVTVAPSSTVWSGPAAAVGARFTCRTVTVTSSVALREPSLDVRRNVNVVSSVTSGAGNVGDAALASLSVTVGPAVCVHEYVTSSPSGSLPEPASVTVVRSSTV